MAACKEISESKQVAEAFGRHGSRECSGEQNRYSSHTHGKRDLLSRSLNNICGDSIILVDSSKLTDM